MPDNQRGRELMDTVDTVPVFARPVIDADASDVTIEDRTARYRRAEVRALTLGATDAAAGWTALEASRPTATKTRGRRRGGVGSGYDF